MQDQLTDKAYLLLPNMRSIVRFVELERLCKVILKDIDGFVKVHISTNLIDERTKPIKNGGVELGYVKLVTQLNNQRYWQINKIYFLLL